MPKYRGRVDCFLNTTPADSISTVNRATGELFVNMVQHISSSGADLGIEMIAANFGVGGTGFNFWNENNPAGIRAWACFRFHSASLGKFDCLIFQQTGSISTNYGGPAICGLTSSPATNTHATNNSLGISFACHPSGSNVTQTDGPWNGTYSLTSASLGNPIWKVTPNSKGAFFPRRNGILGAFSGSRNYMAPIMGGGSTETKTLPARHHVIVSEDSLTLLSNFSNDINYKVMHFGSFLPRSGTVQDSPYAMFANASETSPPIPNFGLGGLAGGTANPAGTPPASEGGISHPDLTSGSRNYSSYTVALDENIGYNRFVSGGGFERVPMWAVVYEAPNHYGFLGMMNHITVGTGPVVDSVSAASSSIAIGTNTVGEVVLMVPWSGPSPGISRVRTGRTFSIG